MTANKEVMPVVKRRPPAAGMGRKKGTPNKVTKALREAVVEAAEKVGEDGKGKNGAVGYLVQLAQKEPKAFASLLGRAMPLQVEGPGEGGAHVFHKIVVEVVKPT